VGIVSLFYILIL